MKKEKLVKELKKQLENRDEFVKNGPHTDMGQVWLSRTKELLAKIDFGMSKEFDDLGKQTLLPLSSITKRPILARMVTILRNGVNYLELSDSPQNDNIQNNNELPASTKIRNERGDDGGKIFIVTNKIEGTGQIIADGGSGTIGGKGGEINIVSKKNKFSGRISTKGGESLSRTKDNFWSWDKIFWRIFIPIIIALILFYISGIN